MKIDKVQPIQYSAYEYWKKYKPYAHKILHNYTDDADLHDNLNSSLYFMFCSICRYINYSKFPISYIKEAIKRLARRLFNYNGYKYKVSQIEKREPLLKDDLVSHLDITLDDYLINKQIKRLLATLPEKHRLILLMHFGIAPYNKMTYNEIAEKLNMSWVNASKLEKTAIKRLKKELNNNRYFSVNDFITEQKRRVIPVDVIKEMVKRSNFRVEDFKYV